MFAGLIYIPFLLLAGIFFLMAYSNYIIPFSLLWIGIIPFTIAVGAYIIRNGLNEWWYTRHPPGLSDMEKNILARFFPYYRQLSLRHKKKFEDRVSVFRLQKQFQMRLLEKIPGDLQLLLSATAIQLSMGIEGQKEFLSDLGMIVFFPKEFITPDINTQLHHVELNTDIFNCLLIGIEFFVQGLKDPENYYHSGLHGMAKAFKIEHGYSDDDIPYPDKKELLVKLHHLREFKIGYQFLYTGLPNLEVFEMCTEHFFQIPNKMQEHLPEVYRYFMDIYHQDPANENSPIIQNIDDHSQMGGNQEAA
ncbi:M90 metallopeptidase family protein [Aureispira anguillae]|uniref:Uncharacterized protein n=1 Tax=Aureispira anguillae TaxID=2864201 RepID=A0A915YL42_9BACT|nr:hypothetical protein [Aureispira anguillae]BDS15004.1 hypothetical protein AsAng_0057860 [Aureispira anguillae]